MNYSLLYVEDDRDMAELNMEILSNRGFMIIYADSGEAAIKYYKDYHPDIILLDIVMPGIDGYTLAREIRSVDELTPILFLTSLADKENAVKGLKLGANDYIRKDSDIEEIAARLHNAARSLPKRYKRLNITENTLLDTAMREVISFGKITPLSGSEYELLYFLIFNPNKIHRREFIVSRIWGNMINGDIYLRKTLSHLRQILSGDRELELKTYRGKGIIFINAG